MSGYVLTCFYMSVTFSSDLPLLVTENTVILGLRRSLEVPDGVCDIDLEFDMVIVFALCSKFLHHFLFLKVERTSMFVNS